MQYAYSWYEIVGMCTLTGTLIVAGFKGLDLALDALIERRRKSKDRQVDGA